MKDLPIVWQRLVNATGTTCPRCAGTGDEVRSAVERLASALQPLGVRPVLQVGDIDQAAFSERPSESNRIWIGGRPLESWLEGKEGSSRCCNECGDNDCRTLEVGGQTYEVIPEALLIRAGLAAASTMLEDSPPRPVDPGFNRSGSLTMKTIQIFDPALCCSTGVCGVDVDQALVEFAADVDWLKKQGVTVERFNLAQQPQAFANHATIRDLLHAQGETALPAILADGELKHRGIPYPSRDQLAQWAGAAPGTSILTEQVAARERGHLDKKGTGPAIKVVAASSAPAQGACCGPAAAAPATGTASKCC